MRVLTIHNRYSTRSPSGENVVVDMGVAMLRQQGLSVDTLMPENPSDMKSGLRSWSAASRSLVSLRVKLVNEVQIREPDVIHVHNVIPLLGIASVLASVPEDVALVQTLHNYRLRCIAGTYWRDGAECHDCDPVPVALPGVWHGCYADSRVRSLVATLQRDHHLEAYLRRVDTFIAISDHMRRRVVSWGIPPAKVVVVPNIGAKSAGDSESIGRDRLIVFAGRLESSKGVEELLEAWAARSVVDGSLMILGDGPLRHRVEAVAAVDPSVVFRGSVNRGEVADHLGRAVAAIVPSQWAEPFGLSALEAMLMGTPVIASNKGALPEVVAGGGWIVAGGAHDLAGAIDAALALHEQSEWIERSMAARARGEALSDGDRWVSQIRAAYSTAQASRLALTNR